MAIIYMGSMDDRVRKYPWSVINSNINAYTNSILQNTLIGHKSAINDGYLLANPLLRNNLFKNKNSILRDLFSTGEIIVPGRKSTFKELIYEQSKNGVRAFDRIPNDIVRQLSSVDRELNHFEARIKGPESIKVWNGFYELMKSLENRSVSEFGIGHSLVTEDDFKRALNTYLNLPHNEKPPSRTEWEKVLDDLSKKYPSEGGFTSSKHTKNALMNLANEAYHYNFSRKLAEESGLRIDIETVHTPVFSHFLEEEQSHLSSLVENLPLISIPRVNNLLKRESIEKILDSNQVIGRARVEFIKSLDKFEAGATDSSLDELRYQARVYNALLNEEFGRPELVSNIAAGVNFTISMLIAPFDQIAAAISWGIADFGTQKVTKKFITERPITLDYKRYVMASSKIKGT